MEKAEIAQLINNIHAIQEYFESTKKYMPLVSKLVIFIEDIIPLLDIIYADLHQSSNLIPKASEKLDKVTSATEMAATEVMDIVDTVVARLKKIDGCLDHLEETAPEASHDSIKQTTAEIRAEIDHCQDDLFSIMNALQFQDITTQQINAIGETIDTVHLKLAELLKCFAEDGVTLFTRRKQVAYDADAEYNHTKSAQSQKIADELLKQKEIIGTGEKSEDASASDDHEIILGEDGQPDIKAIMNQLQSEEGE